MNDNSEDNQDREANLRERIVSSVRSIGQAPAKPVGELELQRLKTAASRLDQMLKASANADQQALKDAVGRLNQLLSGIRTGEDVTGKLERRNRATSRPAQNPD